MCSWQLLVVSWALFSYEQVEVNTSEDNEKTSRVSGPAMNKAVDGTNKAEFDKENIPGKVGLWPTQDC